VVDIVETILAAIGSEFDGECHLSEGQARQAAAEIQRLRAEVERLEADIASRTEFTAMNIRNKVYAARAEERERAAQIAERHNIMAAALIRAEASKEGGEG
jgi:ElaB/YqjD/DUF883 family membrane-anchored ribosome-binding protein